MFSYIISIIEKIMPNIRKSQKIVEKITTKDGGEITVNLNLNITIDGGEIKISVDNLDKNNFNKTQSLEKEDKFEVDPDGDFDFQIPQVENFGKTIE